MTGLTTRSPNPRMTTMSAPNTPERATSVQRSLTGLLDALPLAALRLHLHSDDVPMTSPLLRGVWGRALHTMDRSLYGLVFRPPAPAVPLYVIRPADTGDALEFLVFGKAVASLPRLLRAWDVASGMGLGPVRDPFRIESVETLNREGSCTADWSAPPVTTAGNLLSPSPCGAHRLVTATPLRIARKTDTTEYTEESPSLSRICVVLLRRIANLAGIQPPHGLIPEVMHLADKLAPESLAGQRCDITRYSGSQKAELHLHAVMGALELPDGPGELAPLIQVADWLHVGKATNVGLGRLRLEST